MRWQHESQAVLPDSVESLWLGGQPQGNDAAKGKPVKKAKKDAGQQAPDYRPKIGKKRLEMAFGEEILREIICALLEDTVHGAPLSVLKDRARDAMEREKQPPFAVVSHGGWVFATTTSHTDTASVSLLAPGSIPPQCKVNGVPCLIVDFDRESGVFETQGLGRGWPPGLILELQPLWHDGARADTLYSHVEDVMWELEAMGIVRAERQGAGCGEPIFFAQHPALLAVV